MKEVSNKNKGEASSYQYAALFGVFGLVVMMIPAVLMCNDARSHVTDYKVIKKADNKIVYTPLHMPNNVHVMEFGGWGPDTIIYNYVNVGDTITGMDYTLGKPVVPSWEKDLLAMPKPIIELVNGKNFDDIQAQNRLAREIARRDSIIREMNQKQK